jgi:hypothetical protein
MPARLSGAAPVCRGGAWLVSFSRLGRCTPEGGAMSGGLVLALPIIVALAGLPFSAGSGGALEGATPAPMTVVLACGRALALGDAACCELAGGIPAPGNGKCKCKGDAAFADRAAVEPGLAGSALAGAPLRACVGRAAAPAG